MIGQPCENVGEPGVRIDVVELGSLDERIEGGPAAAFVRGGLKRPDSGAGNHNHLSVSSADWANVCLGRPV